MHKRIQIALVVFMSVGVFELVRRRRPGERYALLWMGAAQLLVMVAVWQHRLYMISRAVGIYYPPNTFFVIAFGFAVLLLLHFRLRHRSSLRKRVSWPSASRCSRPVRPSLVRRRHEQKQTRTSPSSSSQADGVGCDHG